MFLLIFLEREKHPINALTRDQTHNLGMCPDWESNLKPFGVQNNAPANWATSQGKPVPFYNSDFCLNHPGAQFLAQYQNSRYLLT